MIMAIRKLNLVMSYPVEWSLYQIMNNFIQNFYDAVGQNNFMDKFRYTFEETQIVLQSDVGFSKEWLFFIGASTKRKRNKVCAGKFGEGFKIASLTAYRDLGLEIQMESRDWLLKVTDVEDTIDKVPVKVLAYDIEKRPFEENAILILSNAKPEHFKEMKRQISHFYYEGNSGFGKCIAKGHTYAIYHAVQEVGEKKNYGSLFLNYQRRDTLELPIVVCNHCYEVSDDDRDRITLNIYDSNESIREVFRQVTPKEALELLTICRPRWKNTYDNGYRRRNWYGMLKILVDIVYNDPGTRAEFERTYADCLIVEEVGYFIRKNDKALMLEWYRNSEFSKSRQMVCGIFSKFNIPSIYRLCKQCNGFDEDVETNRVQKKYLDILQEITWNYFGDLVVYDTLPECRIIINNKSTLAGKACYIKQKSKIINTAGLRVIGEMKVIYVKEEFLQKDKFSEALVVYLHELLHQFGGDCSAQFKQALLLMNKRLLQNMDEIQAYEERWKMVE